MNRGIVKVGWALIAFVLFANFVAGVAPPESINLEQYAHEVELTSEECQRDGMVVTIVRPIGGWGTDFIAKVRIDSGEASLVKGYVDGATGSNFSVGGQALGFGISGVDIWLDPEVLQENSEGDSVSRIFTVNATFKRIVMLVANQYQTLPIGTIICSA